MGYKKINREQQLRYTSNISQIAGITKVQACEGKGKGTEMFQVRTGGGLCFTALTDKCLDIGEVTYKGININFLNKNGLVGNQWFNNFENEFLYYFSGGMLVTCGLQNTGGANRDKDGNYNCLHGRIGMTPAENVYSSCRWENDDSYIMEMGGRMRESALFGINLLLERKITAAMESNEITIHDTLYNDSDSIAKYLILYHFNFGYPFLGPELKINLKGTVKPRTPEAEKGIDRYLEMTEPQDGFFEHVFFHDLVTDDEGKCIVKLENPKLKIGAYIKFDKSQLPVLTQWKSMRSGDYALGIEPGNSHLGGRNVEEENGTISIIEPFSKKEFIVTLGFYDL